MFDHVVVYQVLSLDFYFLLEKQTQVLTNIKIN